MGRVDFAAGFLMDESLRRELEGRALNIIPPETKRKNRPQAVLPLLLLSVGLDNTSIDLLDGNGVAAGKSNDSVNV